MESSNDRIIAIFKLCKELILKSKEEWDLLYKNLIPILEHNRNTLLKYDEHYVKNKVKENLIYLLQTDKNYIKLF